MVVFRIMRGLSMNNAKFEFVFLCRKHDGSAWQAEHLGLQRSDPDLFARRIYSAVPLCFAHARKRVYIV